MFKTSVLSLALASSVLSGTAMADNNLLFILDSSNSMWGQIEGKVKMDTAKSVLRSTVSTMSADVAPGLMVYGHRDRKSCADVQLVVPVAKGSAPVIGDLVDVLSPHGKTPIAASLRAAATAFEGREEENNSILLISDGIETCNGDPCAEAGELIKRGINVRVNVVGFNVDAQTRAQLQCIAKAGLGEYFDARNAADFKVAVEKAKATVVVPQPKAEPKPIPAPAEAWFEDDFDGTSLGDHWELLNANHDTHLVENGVLTLVAKDGMAASFPSAENILKLKKPVPKGNWTMTARFILTPQTMGEMVKLGIAKGAKSQLFSTMELNSYNYALTNIFVRSDKVAKAKATGFSRNVFKIDDRVLQKRAAQYTGKIKAVQLRLQKSGRNYVSSISLEPTSLGSEATSNGEWLTVQKLTSLRAPGNNLALVFGSKSNDYTPNTGEGLLKVDWVKIEQN